MLASNSVVKLADDAVPGVSRPARSLSGADLSGEDLREAHLAGANLAGARLMRAKLQGLDLRGACLREARLDGADLRDAILDGADLRAASLAGTLLDGARLEHVDLTLAHLRGADLRSADLVDTSASDADFSASRLDRANLSGANLIGAELGGASLRGAALCGANLRESHLDGTDFTGARFAFTVLAASDLSHARGLETVIHDGPSTVGIDAFLLSRGEIPDRFLSGIGLSPLAIEYLKAVAVAEEGMLVGNALFLVFADADRARARRLRAYLRLHHHLAWYWQEAGELTGRHNPDLKLRVRFHDRLIVLGSAHAHGKLAETIATAFAKEDSERRRIVLGVRVGDGPLPSVVPADRWVADFRAVDWDDPRDPVFRRELERLLAVLASE